MADISGFGVGTYLIASATYPVGIQLTQYSDDTDWIAIDDLTLAEVAMAGNGELVTWSALNPISLSLSFIPGGDDDQLLSVLAERNRVGRGKTSARDEITLVNISPTGAVTTYTDGKLVTAPMGNSITSASRIKTKVYAFMFGNRVGV